MCRRVKDVMRPQVTAAATERVGDMIGYLATLNLTIAPVVDGDGRLAGVVSLGRLVQADDNDLVEDHMSAAVVTVEPTSTVEEAVQVAISAGITRLAVVDGERRVVGAVTLLSLARALFASARSSPKTGL